MLPVSSDRKGRTVAEMPNINIQIDQEALREQVGGVIKSELREAAMRLRFAADQLDPGWIVEHNEMVEREAHQRWDREQEKNHG